MIENKEGLRADEIHRDYGLQACWIQSEAQGARNNLFSKQRSPTKYVDNFVKKSADIGPEAAFMRVGNKTMSKKAVENPMKSMTCHEKSGFAGDFVFWDGCRRRLWSIPVLHTPERLVFTDV